MQPIIDTLRLAAAAAHRAGYPHTCPGTARERELISLGKSLGWDEAISAAKMTGDKGMSDLRKLIEAVENGSCPLRLLTDAGLGGGNIDQAITIRDAFNGSLDAAKRLHEALLPGWPVKLTISGGKKDHHWAWTDEAVGLRQLGFTAPSDNPARAWLIAILKAYEVQQCPANQ